MNWLTSNSTYMMERATGFLWTKQTAILDNIANVETPGYKAKYVNFEDALRTSIESAAGGSRAGASIRDALTDARAVTQVAGDESTRLDENGVNLTEQGVELARNAYQLQYTMQAFSGNMSILNAAIKGQ